MTMKVKEKERKTEGNKKKKPVSQRELEIQAQRSNKHTMRKHCKDKGFFFIQKKKRLIKINIHTA